MILALTGADLKDIVLAALAILPASLAAVSSILNGRKIDRNHDIILNGGRAGGGRTRAESKRKGQKPKHDWFRPPNLS